MSSDATPEDIFVCQMCGDCCRGYGGTYVTETDIRAIADYLQMDFERFKARYCCLSGARYVLGQSEDGYCVFWDTLCRIHPVKPRMCRNWPFIPAVLEEVANWRIMADSCPGMRTNFPEEIVARVVAGCIAERRQKRRKAALQGPWPNQS